MKRKSKGRIDRSETFDEFLEKDGLLGEAEDTALKEIIAEQIRVAMRKKGLTIAKRIAPSDQIWRNTLRYSALHYAFGKYPFLRK